MDEPPKRQEQQAARYAALSVTETNPYVRGAISLLCCAGLSRAGELPMRQERRTAWQERGRETQASAGPARGRAPAPLRAAGASAP